MSNNESSFANVADAIHQTNVALDAYDAAAERAAASAETVVALEADVAAIHQNTANQDTRTRISKLTAATSGLNLAKGDLKIAEDAAATQKDTAVRTGKATASRLFEIRDLLRIKRTADVSAWLTEQFNWALVPGFRVQDLAVTHTTVRAIGDLGVSQLDFELRHSDEYSVTALRRLDAHWSELKPLVDASGLELNIAPISVPPAKPKQTVGATMSPALVAA